MGKVPLYMDIKYNDENGEVNNKMVLREVTRMINSNRDTWFSLNVNRVKEIKDE